ncbi:hypothetical protein GCM10023085_45340 [Actinomadura viridis]|uniref:Uncharacterized protein n=1 Tax=Actinomadura viridis TaxID=58110 RepID=A0A931DEZ9_9ACTN|nr:hypothetical protein [Actinomadura viridis]MBG6089894.1 hypothetical protein [Actinomadura viridis]
MAFADQAALAEDPAFRNRVRMAIVTAAKDIMGEAPDGMSDATAGKRQALAYDVLTGSAMFVDRFTWAVAANPAVTGESPDDAIQFTVNSSWDDLAGVRVSD